MQPTPAMAQPNSRGPMSDTGPATATGRTKVSNAAVDAVATCGDTIPAYSTRNPTTAMEMTAAALCVETVVAITMNTAPTRNRAQ